MDLLFRIRQITGYECNDECIVPTMFYLFQTKDVYTFVSNTRGIIFLYTETWDTFSVLF